MAQSCSSQTWFVASVSPKNQTWVTSQQIHATPSSTSSAYKPTNSTNRPSGIGGALQWLLGRPAGFTSRAGIEYLAPFSNATCFSSTSSAPELTTGSSSAEAQKKRPACCASGPRLTRPPACATPSTPSTATPLSSNTSSSAAEADFLPAGCSSSSSTAGMLARAGSAAGAGVSRDSFRLASNARATISLNHLLADPELLFMDMFQTHLLPKSSVLASTQRQVFHNIERAALWMVALTRRMRTWHGDGDGCESGQEARGGGQRGGASAVSRALSKEAQRLHDVATVAERQCNPELSAELFTQLVAVQPCAVSYARLSKQYTDMTYVGGGTVPRDKVVELNTLALEVAEKAVEADPEQVLGHIALCVSKGRLALVSDNRKKIQLAKEAADDAANALRIDPNNDLAHHLMGRWHFEMAQINSVARTLIRILFGTTLMQGTFQEALQFYRTAAELSPVRVIHRVEIGRTLLKLGDHQGAVEHFEHALGMEIEDINAKQEQEDALLLLNKLKGSCRQDLYVKPAAAVAGMALP